jgi:serine O-acetyltransferase
VVRPQLSHRRVVGRIDLDHHLMPDPVGDAIEVLLDRVEFLEARLTHMQKRLRDAGAPGRVDDPAVPMPDCVGATSLMETCNG